MKYVIDRIENNIAVCECEDKTFIDIDLDKLYQDAKEGDHFKFLNGKYVFDEKETIKARNKNIALQNSLFE